MLNIHLACENFVTPVSSTKRKSCGCLERGIEAFENIAVIFLYQNILAVAILRQSVHQAGLVNIDKTSLADAYTLLNPRTVARHHHHATLARTLQANDQVCKA